MIEIGPFDSPICVIGMKRSGHNAVAHWIISLIGGASYYNDCILADGAVLVKGEGEIIPGPGPHAVLGFEDQIPWATHALANLKARKTVLVLRDPYNQFASRIRRRRNYDSYDPNGIKWDDYCDTELWKQFALEFLNDGSSLINPVLVNYNRWFVDQAYRIELASHFGPYTESSLNQIPFHGNGSSFDGKLLDGRASEMKVLDRWKHFRYDSEYVRAILQDPDLPILSKKSCDLVVVPSLL